MARELFVLLNKFVKVQDVFIPGKRRLITRSRFGFVVVSGPIEADTLIRKANGLWVMNQMIVVKEAFSERPRQPLGRAVPLRGIRASKVLGTVSFSSEKLGPTDAMHRKSYAEALQGQVGEVRCPSPGGLHVEEERTQWLYCSLVGVLAEGKDAVSFKEEFLSLKPLPFQLTDCGGKLFILTFPTRGDRDRALSEDSQALLQWFLWLRPWSNGCKPGELRDAWIKCSGMPHQLWNFENFSQIGELWGEVQRGDHVVNMMAMTFGWIKVRTSALQPIAKEISLLNNGVLSQIFVTEELIFNPEHWVLGFHSGGLSADSNGASEANRDVFQGVSSQRSHVSDSCVSKGYRGKGISRSYGCMKAAGQVHKEKETCDIFRFEKVADSSNSHISPPVDRSIVPFVPPVNVALDHGCLVVDLGRAFGPIPLIRNTIEPGGSLVERLTQSNVGVDIESRGTPSDGGLRQESSDPPTSSQGVISKLGEKGRLLGDIPAAINLASSSVRRGRGVILKKRNSGAVVRAAAVALTRGNSSEQSQRHQLLM
ncbi:hypothetical protein Dimus_015971 [Dionaea muscipula]